MGYSLLLSAAYGPDGFDFQALMKTFATMDFFWFVVAYYVYFFTMVSAVTLIAVFGFQIDYFSNMKPEQVRKEFFITLEGYTTNALCYWILLQVCTTWSTALNPVEIGIAFFANSIIFCVWFYWSHRLWHSNRFLYKWVHIHHHESVVVCPFTALNNRWTESVWTSVGFALGPFFLMNMMGLPNNIWGWYGAIFAIVGEAIIGHSRLPFTLEHATHHVQVNKNYGFYADTTGRFNWDRMFGTWAYANDVSKIQKNYPKESQLYTWNDLARHMN